MQRMKIWKLLPLTERLIDRVGRIADDAPDKFTIAYSVADVRRHFEQGIILLPMGMENGSPIESNLDSTGTRHLLGSR